MLATVPEQSRQAARAVSNERSSGRLDISNSLKIKVFSRLSRYPLAGMNLSPQSNLRTSAGGDTIQTGRMAGYPAD
jgi:hypothetical protein